MKINFSCAVSNHTIFTLVLVVFFMIQCVAKENYIVNISLPRNKSVDSVFLADHSMNLLEFQKVNNTFYLDKIHVVQSECKSYTLQIHVSNRIYICDYFTFPLQKNEIDIEITATRKLSKYLGFFFFTFSGDYGFVHKYCFYYQNRPRIEQIRSKPR